MKSTSILVVIKLIALSFLVYFFCSLLIGSITPDPRNLLNANKFRKYIIGISIIGLTGSIYSFVSVFLKLVKYKKI
jgi:hypothetical protein